MVCFGGLEFIAAGYLIAEHSKKKKKEEQKRIEEEEEAASRQQALHSSHHHHHRRRRRHSDGEREDRRHKERAWIEPVPRKERKELEYRPRKEKRRDGEHRTSSPAPRRGSPLPSKSHIDRPYAHPPSMSATQLNTPYAYAHPTSSAVSTYLAPLNQHPRFTRAGSDPPPSRLQNQAPYNQPMAPASHSTQMIPAHQQIHNSIFPTAPPSLYRASPLSQAITPSAGRTTSPRTNRPYPTYHPPSPPSPPPPASALSSRPQFTTPSPPSQQTALAPPPPPEGVWELAAGDAVHPNPARVSQQRRRASSSASSRPHVHFADGLDVHEEIADPPPPYQEY